MSRAPSLRRLRRPMPPAPPRLVPLAALGGLCLLASAARATVDLRLDTSSFVPGQPSVLSVQGVVDQTGPSWAVTGALITLRFDPAKVSVSNFQPGSDGWTLNAYNLDHVSEGWISVLLTNGDNNGYGQLTDGPVLTFTVTPADGPVNAADCATLRLSGDESSFSDQHYYTGQPSDPCNGRNTPISGNPGDPVGGPSGPSGGLHGGTESPSGGPGNDPIGAGMSTIIESVKHILRYAAGLAPEPSRFRWPYTENDAATMELTDTNFTMVASPPQACNIPTARRLTIADAVLYVRIANSYQSRAAWSMDFLGNPQLGGNAANATGMPALADIDGDGRLEAVFPMGMLNGTNYFDPRYTGNPNEVYILKDLNGYGSYGLKLGNSNTPGFPQPLKDAPTGVTIANIVPPASGADRPEIIVSNFQDVYDRNNQYLGDLYSRPYVFDSDGRGVDPFASSDNPDSPYGLSLGHGNSATAVWDVDKNGQPEIFFPALGHYDRQQFQGTYGGSIKRLEATRQQDGTVTVSVRAIQKANPDSRWLTEPDVPEGPGQVASSSHAEFQAPPVMIRTLLSDPNSDRIVAAATRAGDVYGWNKDGDRIFYFQTDEITHTIGGAPKPRGRASVYNPMAAGDVTGDGRSDLVVATGQNLNYTERECEVDPPEIARYWDGYIYCYAPDAQGVWSKAWRYPATDILDEYGRPGGRPAFSSGVAVGRLLGPGLPPCIVAVDASGRVVALNGASGKELWTFDFPWKPGVPGSKSAHRYMRGSVTQPLILDINGDGYEDVIVGTTSGWVWFLNGHPAGSQGEQLAGHPPIHTIRSADSTTKSGVVEPQYEEVRGLAVGPMKATPQNPTDGQTRAILLVTSGRAGLTFPPQVGGHAFLFDLGAGSWNPNAASWPQFGQNAQRTGHYPGP